MSIEELTAALSARCNDLAGKHQAVLYEWSTDVTIWLQGTGWLAMASMPGPEHAINTKRHADPFAALDELDALLSARAAANPTQEQLAATLDVPVLP